MGAMLPPIPRPAPALDLQVGGAMFVVAALGLPLGLDRPAAAELIVLGQGLSPQAVEASRPLAALLIRGFASLPIGDLPTRANLASAAAAALAAMFLVRLVAEALAATRADGGKHPLSEGQSQPYSQAHSQPYSQRFVQARPGIPAYQQLRGIDETAAAIAGALIPLLCLTVFQAVTSATGTATTLAVLAAGWLSAWRLWRQPGRTREGLALALSAGLSLGADPVAPLLLGPLALAIWWRSLRRGERWPLLAPAATVAAAAICLYPAPNASAPLQLPQLARAVIESAAGLADVASAAASSARVHGSVAEVVAQLGVVAGLTALVGMVVLILRAPLGALAVMTSVLVGLAVAATGNEVASSGWAVLLAAAGLPLAVGVVHLGSKLGGARVPAAVVVAVVALTTPALDGGHRRWQRTSTCRVTERLLVEAQAGLSPRAVVDPGSPVMSSLFSYGRSLGLRPDLQLVRRVAAPAVGPSPRVASAPAPAVAGQDIASSSDVRH